MKHSFLLTSILALLLPWVARAQNPTEQRGITRFYNNAIDLISSDTGRHSRVSYFVTPILGYTPETGVIIGVSPMFVFSPKGADPNNHGRASNVDFNLDLTQKRQVVLNAIYNAFFDKEKYYLRGTTAVSRFVYDYWGIGPRAADGNKSSYNYDILTTDNILQYNVFRKWYAGAGYRYESMQRLRHSEDSYLEATRPAGWNGSVVSGPKLGITFDDRDNILTASRGWYFDVNYEFLNKAFGSQFSFQELDFDLRHYHRLSERHDQILAWQTVAQFTLGEAPFKDLSLLGGPQILRGYYQGRYRDNHYWAAQTEYRRHIYGPFGMAAFVGVGQVAPRVNAFTFDYLKYAGGLGLRLKVLPRENVNARWDVAVNRDGQFNFYLIVSEAF